MSRFIRCCFILFLCSPAVAAPFYIGGLGGYGSTTWFGLVPGSENQNEAISLSTPIGVQEGGGTWGVFTGYELSKTFAVELSYMRFPDATVTFDELSIFSFDHDGLTKLQTHTETVNAMGKIMMDIPTTSIRLYSGAGLAIVHRKDLILDQWRAEPTFGLGLNTLFNGKILAEIDGNYTVGFGESQLNPTDTYFPFLYAITFRLAYCFG